MKRSIIAGLSYIVALCISGYFFHYLIDGRSTTLSQASLFKKIALALELPAIFFSSLFTAGQIAYALTISKSEQRELATTSESFLPYLNLAISILVIVDRIIASNRTTVSQLGHWLLLAYGFGLLIYSLVKIKRRSQSAQGTNR